MRYVLTDPMVISARLMPAVRVGPDSWIHLEITGRNPEGRITTRCIIDDGRRTIYDDEGPSSGVGSEPDIRDLMSTALAFLTAEAESYQFSVEPREECWIWSYEVAQWAYQNSDDLSYLELTLEGGDD